MLPAFALDRPATIDDAVAALDDDHVAYWGGTELLLAMTMGMLTPQGLVDLKHIPELRGVRRTDQSIVIGAGTTHDELANDPVLADTLPLLAYVERHIGNARVRAQGSIGGNLCFAEPRSDVATVLMALNGTVTLRSSSGSRTIPVTEFVLGPYWTAREPGELLVEVTVPLPAPTGAYRKLQVTERPTVGVAAVQLPNGSCRLVVGAVAEVPRAFDYAAWAEVDPAALAEQLEPVADLTGSVEYKRHVTAVYVRRAIAAIQQEAGND